MQIPEGSHGPSQLTGPRAWLVLAVTSITVVLIFINASGLNVALSAISRDLNATGSQSSWFLLSYMLVATAFILVFGRAADVFGRKSLYIGGIIVFLAGSLACGLAPTAESLIAFRFVQGLGAASVITNNTAILTDMFPPRFLSTALGVNATAAAVGQALGPVAGGVVVELLGWRWMFLLAVPLLVIGLTASVKLIPGSRRAGRRERMDVSGAVLVVTGLGGLVLAMNGLPGGGGIGNPWVWGPGAGSIVCLAAFIGLQRRRQSPLIDLGIFDRSTVLLYISGFLCAFSNYAVVLLTSLYLQAALGRTALEAGLMVVPSPIGTVIAALCCGWLVKRFHHGTLTGIGMLLVASGSLGVGLSLGLGWIDYGIPAGLFAVGVGTGLFMTPNTGALMLRVPSARRGIANAVRSTLQNAGYLFSTSIALSVATVLLTESDRASAYAGRLLARGGDIGAFETGVLIAIGVLICAAAGGAAMSFATRREVAPPFVVRESEYATPR